LTTFHGRPCENISDWLYYTNRVLIHTSHNDKEKVLLASSYLRDIAQQDYMLHEQAHANLTWSQFTEYLREKYTPKNHTTVVRRQLKSLRHLASVNEYYVSFRKLVNQLPNMSEEDRMINFIDGLKSKTRHHVRSEKPTNLDEAYDLASDFETFNSFEDEPRNNSYLAESTMVVHRPSHSHDHSYNSNQATGHKFQQHNNNSSRNNYINQQRTQQQPYKSNNYNNSQNNSSTRNQSNYNQTPQRAEPAKDQVRCCKCGRLGHIDASQKRMINESVCALFILKNQYTH